MYFFSSKGAKGKIPLSRAYFNRQINDLLKNVPEFKENGIILTSHDFRHGYITELWQKTGDIQFVSEVMGQNNRESGGTLTGPWSPGLSNDWNIAKRGQKAYIGFWHLKA